MKELLLKFGLTEGEAELYYALLRLGKATIDECIKLSNVRRTTAYTIVKRLIKKGLVAEVAGKPVRFCPLPPREALRTIVEKKILEVSNLYEELPRIADDVITEADRLYSGNPLSIESESELMILRGAGVVKDVIRQSLERAKRVIRNIVRSPLIVVFGRPVEKEIEEYRSRGIEKRMIFEDELLRSPQVAEDCIKYIENGIIVKHVKKAPSKLLIVDEFASLTVIRHNADPEKMTTLFSQNKELIHLQIYAFEALWEKSDTLSLDDIEKLKMG